ncbi:hypothetical protein [Kribbella sp. DT2]|uniref:hypothetical protein n=1 Tax=Kribbella sp. DT2 TaxID=3393427 RepID=UPI003CEF856F
MFWKLLAAPRWIVGGSLALVVFVGYSIGFKLTKEQLSWPEALLIGALGGVVVAVAVVLGLTMRRRELKAVGVDRLSPGQQAKAYRAAQKGQIDADPEIRAATLRIAEYRVKGGSRQKTLLVVAAVLVGASAVINLTAGSGRSAVLGLVVVAALVVLVVQLRTARRRAAELLNAAAGDAAAHVPASASAPEPTSTSTSAPGSTSTHAPSSSPSGSPDNGLSEDGKG